MIFMKIVYYYLAKILDNLASKINFGVITLPQKNKGQKNYSNSRWAHRSKCSKCHPQDQTGLQSKVEIKRKYVSLHGSIQKAAGAKWVVARPLGGVGQPPYDRWDHPLLVGCFSTSLLGVFWWDHLNPPNDEYVGHPIHVT